MFGRFVWRNKDISSYIIQYYIESQTFWLFVHHFTASVHESLTTSSHLWLSLKPVAVAGAEPHSYYGRYHLQTGVKFHSNCSKLWSLSTIYNCDFCKTRFCVAVAWCTRYLVKLKIEWALTVFIDDSYCTPTTLWSHYPLYMWRNFNCALEMRGNAKSLLPILFTTTYKV